MGIKLLISALPNMGKTTLLSSLENVLVIARDGKKYPFPQPHKNIKDFSIDSLSPADEIIEQVSSAIKAYKQKFNNEIPDTIVFDSISKILLDIEGITLQRIKSFPYGVINTEIKKLMDFIEGLTSRCNVILVSHAVYDEESFGFKLVNAGGSWSKKGGVISEVDYAIFLEMVGSDRKIHFKNPLMLSRTIGLDVPDTMMVSEFNLQQYVNQLKNLHIEATNWSL